jgi:ADP-heptose:LPS heptosyltransferase
MAAKKIKGPLLLFPTHYLGNFVLGLPWLCEVNSKFPETTIVIDSAFAPLLNLTSAKSARVILYPRALLDKSNGVLSRAKHYSKFLRQLRQHKHSCLIDMEGERFTGVLSLLSGCSVRYGPTQKNSAWFYTHARNLHYENHRFNSFGELINQWQATETPSSLVSYLNTSEPSKPLDALSSATDRHSKIVVIHPGASAVYKRWPASHFAALSNFLANKDYTVVWIGAGESDSHAVAEIMSHCSEAKTFNLCNQLSFSELVTLLGNSSLYIGADSGPMHLAASTGVAVLALFGPSKESIWRPLGGNSTILRSQLACHPNCRGTVCLRTTHCLNSLSPQVVFNAALSHAPLQKLKAGN